ncbi:vitamin K epoxide reductase family protein [Arcanobacterium canis]|uniref:Vitamin K epoxide reductase family protein n=1 Tax=Arcanobacterium canis TaxID=999183 RepID=A0ABY8G000_9ACTO|nr:vitamin K epoxide reductase family protein [Arcanobacterium canis]WFM84033.1 vitamin K epoxide reductase family protein [Arcanobacterium canis]
MADDLEYREDMNDDELTALEARLNAVDGRYYGSSSEHEQLGGARLGSAITILVTSLVGFVASLGLIMSEKEKLTHPDALLACDLNPLVGCSKWIGQWQNEVFFGISNSVLGFAFFSGMVAIGLMLVTRSRLARVLWQALSLGTSAGIAWVCWFAYMSFFKEGALCPFCVVTWFAMIPLWLTVIGTSLYAGHWGSAGVAPGRMLTRNRWWMTIAIWVAIVAFAIVWFWDQWIILM